MPLPTFETQFWQLWIMATALLFLILMTSSFSGQTLIVQIVQYPVVLQHDKKVAVRVAEAVYIPEAED